MKLSLKTTAFKDRERIPTPYTCDDKNISPPFEWDISSDKIKSFAMSCNDINSKKGTWLHWLIFNIPADERRLPENVPPLHMLGNGSIQAINDFGNVGYGGPCPETGTHNYIFNLFALNTILPPKKDIKKEDFEEMIQGKIMAQATVTGTYQKVT